MVSCCYADPARDAIDEAQLNEMQQSIDRFVRQEGVVAVKVVLDWMRSPAFLLERQKKFEFNTFDVAFDLDGDVVTLIDILDGSGESEVTWAAQDFLEALSEWGG